MTVALEDEIAALAEKNFTGHRVPLISGVPNFKQRTTLDGRAYQLTFRWSMRESKWYLDIHTEEGELLLGSRKLVVNWPLLDAVRGARPEMPPGELFLFGPEPAADPLLDNLASYSLVYTGAA